MILGVYGYHDSGKTQFLEKLIKELKKKRISAAAVKHLGGHYEPDPKKDTSRLAKAGFDPVAGIADGELTIRFSKNDDLWSAISLIELLSAPDVIFVEGFKNEPIEKIAVGDIKELPGTIFRAEKSSQILQYIVKKVKHEKTGNPCGCAEMKSPILSRKKRVDEMTEIELKMVVNGKKLSANEFVQNIVWETLCGMMKSLKGVQGEIKSIEISAKKE